MTNSLFVIIMPIGSNNVYVNLCIEDFVDESMLLRNLSTPLTCTVARELFGVTCACSRMIHQLVDQLHHFFVCIWIVTTKLRDVLLRSLRKNDVVHTQSELSHWFISSRSENRIPSPRRISSRPSSTRRKNSSFVRSVGSACFSAASLRRYLAARFSKASSSAIMLILRSISAFICIAVITFIFLLQK